MKTKINELVSKTGANFYLQFKSSPKNKKNFIYSWLIVTILLCAFLLWIPALILFMLGGTTIRLTILFLYILQLFLGKSEIFYKFCFFLKIYDYFQDYSLIYEEEIQNSHSLLCIHPHGGFGMGASCYLGNKEFHFKQFKFLGTNILQYLPISGILCRLFGLNSSDSNNLKKLMSEGKNIALVPGGFECASITDYTKDRIYIKNRAGFIKYALEFGYKVYPAYSFNENKLYYTLSGFDRLRLFLSKFKITGGIYIGSFLIYPFRNVGLYKVVGKALILPKIENPTEEEVSKYHQKYIESLKDIYDRYKHEYGASEELDIL